MEQLKAALQARVDEITATMSTIDDPLVRMLQSTRARSLMDVIECIDGLKKQSCPTAEALKRQAAERSWQGEVDRQGGSFSDDEIRSRTEWR